MAPDKPLTSAQLTVLTKIVTDYSKLPGNENINVGAFISFFVAYNTCAGTSASTAPQGHEVHK